MNQIPPNSTKLKPFVLLKYWGPVVLYALGIVYLSSQSYPDQRLPSFIFSISDKVLHACEYGVLGILLYRAFKHTIPKGGSMGLAIACVIAFGISDEIHQWFVPERQADIWDVVADTFGAVFLVFGWVLITEKERRRPTIRKAQ